MMLCIEKEILSRNNYLKKHNISSIYFGGGTPSVLNISEIKKILQAINEKYSVLNNVEITLECNPDDLNEKKMIKMKSLGINRLSIGVQSFNDKLLKFMNRSHNASESVKAVKLAKKIGFNNISIDLIYGMPNQSINDWEKSLKIMLDLNIPHFSAYELTVEKKTHLQYLIEKKKILPLKEARIINQFNTLVKLAEKNNFINYEISSFGKKGFFSSHNIGYWNNEKYLGIGPSAHSYNGDSRSWNIASNNQYIKKIINNQPHYEVEYLSQEKKYNEYVFTALRTIWGINIIKIKSLFGEEIQDHFLKECTRWLKEGHVVKNKNLYLLTKKGKKFADRIASDCFIVS